MCVFEVDGTATLRDAACSRSSQGQRLAAALLLPGSGPVDRNGDVPGLNLTPQTLKLIAGVLGELGVVSLRFDKYFTGRTGAGAYAADPGRIDLDAFLRQAAAAYRVLGARPKRGPRRCSSPGTARAACTRCSPRNTDSRPRPGSR
jgi:hypothetical protein